MKLWPKIAFTLLVVAALSTAQTTSSDPSPAPAMPSGASLATPGSSPTAPVPDISFKPVPPTAAPQPMGATGNTKSAAKPATAASAGGSTKTNSAKPAAAAGEKAAAATDSPKYILGPNDVVQVNVFDEPHLPGPYVIGPDGQMSMPLIGNFRAIGLTIPGLEEVIKEKLRAFINDPVVNVQLLRNNSKQYTVMGGVLKSGAFPLLRPTTILDAMAACGGFKDFANPKKIYLMRGSKKYPFNYNEVRKGIHTEQNITIEDGDYIYVPE